MVTSISPTVNVQIRDESFYTPGQASTVPLIFIATADNKLQSDGVSPALGTQESNVLRTVTSISQALELYGVPIFKQTAGEAHHGDARNEYGLDALIKVLGLINRAYVVRANVNLNDEYTNVKSLWTDKISDAASFLNTLIGDYITAYNTENNLVPADVGYKTTVTNAELKTLVIEALNDVLSSYSFSSTQFYNDFIQDHTVAYAGYQEISFDSTSGYVQSSDATGYANDTTLYGFEATVISTNGTDNIQISLQGQNIQTFGTLVSRLQTAIQAATSSSTTVQLIQGKIRITSDLTGATSSVEITSDGYTLNSKLFASANLFKKINDPVDGVGVHTLSIYNDAYSSVVSSYSGLFAIISGTPTYTAAAAETLLITAAAAFDNTKEFKDETSLGANDAARRVAIYTQIQEAINNPDGAFRSEQVEYDLLVAPGYPEVTDELVTLAQARDEEVFVIGETPFDKAPTGPGGIVEWASTVGKVFNNAVAYYYPHGLSSNVDGKVIMSSAATTGLRTIAYSDTVADIFYAPAGTQRGICPHLTDIGYVTGSLGEPTTFVSNGIDKGTRDELLRDGISINPISFVPNRGILVMGEKTTSPVASALDRIPVVRLTKLIKRALRNSLYPYLFEPNDKITWDNIKATTDNYLGSLIGRRALYDFATLVRVAPADIDAHQVNVDVAIKPVKAVEFVYVTVRVVNTGADIGGRTIGTDGTAN